MHEVFCDAPSLHEPCLVGIDDGGNGVFEPVNHDLCELFHGAILQGDGPEGVSSADAFFLGKQDQQRTIEAVEIQATSMEAVEQAKNVVSKEPPKMLVERWPKTIWPRTSIHIHGEENGSDFACAERGGEIPRSKIKGRVEFL